MLIGDSQPTTTMPATGVRSPWRKVIAAALMLALLAGASVGAYFIGQNTRKSDRQVADLTSSAVARETDRQQALRREALDEQAARNKAKMRRTVKKMRREAKQRAERSFVSGQSAGYSSGQSVGKKQGEAEGYAAGSVDGYVDGATEGYDSGISDASDELSCSDDMDVTWLPACG